MSFNEEFCGNCGCFCILRKSEDTNGKDLYFCSRKREIVADPKDWCTHYIDRKAKWYDGY